MRFNDVLLEWLNENHKFYIKENTLMRYRCSINNHIIYYFSNYQIEDINPRVIQKYIYELKETSSDRTRRPLSNSTINNIIAILKLFFNYCVELDNGLLVLSLEVSFNSYMYFCITRGFISSI